MDWRLAEVGRKAVVAEELQIDDLDKVCFALELNEEQCALVREAAESLCKERRGKKKRAPSQYNLYIAECVPKKTGPVTERFKECAAEYKSEKEKGKLE